MYTEEEYSAAAEHYDVPAVSIKTVMEVEAPGGGFLDDGRTKILFEAHYFRDRTGGQYDDEHPTISAPYPASRRYYVGGAGEYDRLEEAKALNESAAFESASWGAGQVMGANWRDLGFPNVQALVQHVQSAAGQMDVMMRFCKFNGLLDHMRRFPDWAAVRAFAAGYNGSGAIDVYAPKIVAAFQNQGPRTVLKRGDRGDDVKALQRVLDIEPDGDFGPVTEDAVRQYQAGHGLDVDGIAGPATLSALGL